MPTIRELREEQGLSQMDVARRIGVAPAAIRRWEHNERTPHPRYLRALARVFGVPMAEIALPGLNGTQNRADSPT